MKGDKMGNKGILALVIAVVVGFGFGAGITLGVTEANKSDSVAECPDGQKLVSVKVSSENGDLNIEQASGDLPAGASFETRASGQGPDYTVRSNASAATVHGNGPLQLEVVCR